MQELSHASARLFIPETILQQDMSENSVGTRCDQMRAHRKISYVRLDLTQIIVFAGLCAIGLVVQGQTNKESRTGERTVLHVKASLNAGSVDSFGLSPDGKSLLVRTADHAIQLWDLSG